MPKPKTQTEYLRASAHQLGLQLERSGEASREISLQDRILKQCSEAVVLPVKM